MQNSNSVNELSENRIKNRTPPNKNKSKKPTLNVSILLLGPAESGKSTILKQLKIMNLNGFSEKERLSFKNIIYQNVMVIIMTILKEMDELQIKFSNQVKNIFLAIGF